MDLKGIDLKGIDVKAKVEEIVAKLQADETLLAEFDEKPAVVLEKLLGVELPDDQVKQLVDAVKAKLKLDNVGDALAGLFGKKKD
ncbi:MAG: hypothetical protein IJC43_07595 [Clostridia bacterium]|nr:hypothetical protein [Clostridia bacterium]